MTSGPFRLALSGWPALSLLRITTTAICARRLGNAAFGIGDVEVGGLLVRQDDLVAEAELGRVGDMEGDRRDHRATAG
jgi:hypothetical protein